MTRRLWGVSAVLVALSGWLAPAAGSAPRGVTFLGDLGGGLSWPLDINDDGLIVGYSEARAVNDAGVIVGQTHTFEPPGFTVAHAAVWEDGVPRLLPSLPGARLTGATDLNERGQIVGFSAFTESGLLHAVLWEGGMIRDLGALEGDFFSGTDSINERGRVVGFSSGVNGPNVLVWEDGGFAIPRPFTQFPNSQAGGINDRGETAGTIYLPTGVCCSAVVAKSVDKRKVVVVQPSAFSVDVNNEGQVIGVDTSGPEYRGFVWG
jgi:probable HAF family extracellular repeat protein